MVPKDALLRYQWIGEIASDFGRALPLAWTVQNGSASCKLQFRSQHNSGVKIRDGSQMGWHFNKCLK